MVSGVRDKNLVFRVTSHVPRIIELAQPRSFFAELHQKITINRQDLKNKNTVGAQNTELKNQMQSQYRTFLSLVLEMFRFRMVKIIRNPNKMAAILFKTNRKPNKMAAILFKTIHSKTKRHSKTEQNAGHFDQYHSKTEHHSKNRTPSTI